MNFLDVAVKSMIVALLGLSAAALMRRSSASSRHFVLALTLVGMCGLPFVAKVAPTWSVPFLRVSAPAPSAEPALAWAPTTVESVSISPANAVPKPFWSDPAEIILTVWGLVAVALAASATTRLARLKRMERVLHMSADPTLHALVAESCRTSNRHVLLLEGAEGQPPMTWGHTRPVLLLPANASRWSPDRLKAVILHELAHMERSDWLISVGAQFVAALFWFNPAVWIIVRRMEAESEIAADDRVLTHGISGPQYAAHLLDLVRQLGTAQKSDRPALAMARHGRLDGRIVAILESKRCRRSTRGFAALGWIAGIAAAVSLIAAAVPTKVLPAVPFRAKLLGQAPVAPDIQIQSRRLDVPSPSAPPAPPIPSSAPTPVKTSTIKVVSMKRRKPAGPRIRAVVKNLEPSVTISGTVHPLCMPEKQLVESGDNFEAAKIAIAIKQAKAFENSRGYFEAKKTNNEVQEATKEIREAAQQFGASAGRQASIEMREAFDEARHELEKKHVKLDLRAIAKAALQMANSAMKKVPQEIPKAEIPKTESPHVEIDLNG